MSARSVVQGYRHTLYETSLKHTILIPIIIFIVALVFKILDVFVWRLDEALGEIIVSKSIGFLLVVLYLYAAGKSVTAIGLHGRRVREALFIGGVGVILVLIITYGAQIGALVGAGKSPSLALTAIDPKAGVTGGLAFAFFLVAGNFVNSFMEEGLFRGIMLTHFRATLSFWKANFLQAAFFGLWHLNWPVKQYITGQVGVVDFVFQSVMLVVATAIFGFAMGYLYLKTNNLWGPWLAHTIANSVPNLLHIRTIDGIDADMMVWNVTLTICYVAALLFFRSLTKRFRMPEMTRWG